MPACETESVAIRVCSPGDAERLGPDFAARWDGQVAGRWDLLTAWNGERLVGSGVLCWEGPFNSMVAEALPDQVEFGFLQVEADCRGRGIGTALLQLALQRGSERGVLSIGLGVGTDNPRAAALYRRLGFVDTGLRFTDTYLAVDVDGGTHCTVEPGSYLIRQLAGEADA